MKKYRRVTSHDTGEWCKVWGKTGSWFQKWHDVNLVNFNASSIRSENLHFDVLLFSIVFKVSAKKSAEELSLMILEKDQNFVKKTLFVWKMTWEIWWVLTGAVKNQKICTLMGYFCQKYVMFEIK